MTTIKNLTQKLGVSAKTISRNKALGYVVVLNDAGEVLLDESIKSFIKFQSEQIRILKSMQKSPKKKNGQERKLKSEPSGLDEWKEEKEKQGALKLRYQNEKDKGELLPTQAFLELVNPMLSLFKSKTLNLSSEAQKRHPFDPDQVRVMDEVSVAVLHTLNERSSDELQQLIKELVERYSKYYDSTQEDPHNFMGD